MASIHTKIFFFFFFCCSSWVVGPSRAHMQAISTYDDLFLFGSWGKADMLSSTFKHNLESALQTFRNLSSFTRYGMLTIGSGEDKVHAMFQCRADLSPQGCMQCLATATAQSLQPPFSPPHAVASTIQPYAVESTIQLNACYFRYSNSTFTERPSFQYAQMGCIEDEGKAIVDRVISLAPGNGGYAVARGSNGHVAIAECLGYLSEMECAQCLSDAASYRDADSFGCPSQMLQMLHFFSCYYRYEEPDFLSASVAMQPPQQFKSAPLRRLGMELL